MKKLTTFAQEEVIQKYLDENNREAAVKLLYELVVACAKAKNFHAAEALRERIFEIDPMALTEIINAGEVIEREKSDSIDKGHREIWAELYNELNPEEAGALYFALETESYPAGATIFSQGERKPRLYFVNSGRLKVFYMKNNREVLLGMIEQGQVVGEDVFFNSSLCTTSMVATSDVELSYLETVVLRNWKKDFPLLEWKLQEFTRKSDSIWEKLRQKELDRRTQKRVIVYGRGDAQLMSGAGSPVGKLFKVDVTDLSRGGAGFMVRITKRETAQLLLGQRINLRYIHPRLGSAGAVDRDGTIVAVRFHPLEDCSVSMRFDELLEAALIDEFERLTPISSDFDF